jgi:hypothetical protein
MPFKVGDRIRRCSDAVSGAPIGFETVVIEPLLRTGADRVWYTNKYGGASCGDVKAFELVSDSPIRTVRRLEPGVYGLLYVGSEVQGYPTREVPVRVAPDHGPTVYAGAPELRELARVALEIAEYLDGLD